VTSTGRVLLRDRSDLPEMMGSSGLANDNLNEDFHQDGKDETKRDLFELE
jgi:hypothetical protein